MTEDILDNTSQLSKEANDSYNKILNDLLKQYSNGDNHDTVIRNIQNLLNVKIIIKDPKVFCTLCNIYAKFPSGGNLLALERSVDALDLAGADIEQLLHKLMRLKLVKILHGLLLRLKLTDEMFKTIHDDAVDSFRKDERVYKNNLEMAYKFFMNNYIFPTRSMVLEILEFISLEYETIREIITKKEYVTCGFNECDRYQEEGLCTSQPNIANLYNLLQDDDDYRKYAVYTMIYNGFKKGEMLKYKKNHNIQFDDALLKYYVFRDHTMQKKILQFFADEGAKPDADTVIGLILRTTVKTSKTLLNNICAVRPDFDFGKFDFEKAIRGSTVTLRKT